MAGTDLVGLIGRAEELALVTQHLHDEGSAGVLLIGPPGVGKTRLARAAVNPVETGDRLVLRATATRSSSTMAFGVLLDLLPPAGTGQSRVEVIQHAIVAVGEAGTGPRRPVLLIDDAHLVDEETALLLLRLAERGLASLLLTVRAGEPVPDAITTLWKDDFVTRVDLQPISRGETSELAASLLDGPIDPAAAQRLWEITGGNPLYIREVLRASRASGALRAVEGLWLWRGGLVPDGQLVDAVATHLDDVDDEVRGVMELVAVGESLPHALVAHVVGPTALHRTEEADVVAVDPTDRQVRPAHPLFGEVIRASMTASAVHEARARLARAVLDLDVDLELGVVSRAVWFLSLDPAPGDPTSGTVASTLRDGATAANRLGDYVLAERLARHAIAHGAGEQATLALAISLVQQSRVGEADILLVDALGSDPDDIWKPAMANAHVALQAWALRDLPRAEDLLDRWSAHVTDPGARDTLAAERANLLLHTGQVHEAFAIASEIVESGAEHHLARCRAFEPMALAAVMLGRTDRSAELAPGLALRAMSIRHLNSLAPIWVATGYFTMLVSRGALAEAVRLIDLIEGATPAHDEQVQALVVGGRGFIESRAGLARDGYEKLARSVAVGATDQGGLAAVINLGGLADAAALCGEPAAAREALDRAASALPAGMAFGEVLLERIAARVRFAEGDLEGARHLCEGSAATYARNGWSGGEAVALYDAVRYGSRGATLDRLIRLGATVEGPAVAAVTQLAAGLRRSDPDAVDLAATAFAGLGCLLDAAESATLAAELHRRAGRHDLAGASTARAQDWFARCHGARSPIVFERPSGSAVELTRREREVAIAAASGSTNREIAEAMTVSVRTVEGHLLRAYGKLGVSDRAGLAAVLRRD